jgi:sirohydrochlorin ferrochelatase
VLVAHGAPSDPAPVDEAMQMLAQQVAARLPGWTVRGATLAADGSLKRAFTGLSDRAIVFPVFMSDGWILGRILPDCLKTLGRAGTPILPPLGNVPAFRTHCADMVKAAISQGDLAPARTTIVLAAHGSARGPVPGAWAKKLATELALACGVRTVIPAFLEEDPFLGDVLRMVPGPAICFPCFATNAGHATQDVPDAVAQSGFTGIVLPTAGTVPVVSRIIARHLMQSPNALVMA